MVGRRLFSPLVIVTILLWAAVFALLTARASLIAMPSAYVVGMVRVVTCSFGALSCGWLYLTLQPINRHPLALQLAVAFVISFDLTPVSSQWNRSGIIKNDSAASSNAEFCNLIASN